MNPEQFGLLGVFDLEELLPGFAVGSLDYGLLRAVIAERGGGDFAEVLFELLRKQFSSSMSPAEWSLVARDLAADLYSTWGWSAQLAHLLLRNEPVAIQTLRAFEVEHQLGNYQLLRLNTENQVFVAVIHGSGHRAARHRWIVAFYDDIDALYEAIANILVEEIGPSMRQADPRLGVWFQLPREILWPALDRIVGTTSEEWLPEIRRVFQSRPRRLSSLLEKTRTSLGARPRGEVDHLIIHMLNEGYVPAGELPPEDLDVLRAFYWACWDWP